MQTSYSIDQAVGRVGAIADSSMVQDIETYKAKAGAIYIGRVVTQGADLEAVVHPDAAGEVTDEKLVKGIVVHSHEMESNNTGSEPIYVQGSIVPVMRKGRIWVEATDAITVGTSTVNVDVTNSASLGKLSGAALASSASAVLPKAKFKSNTSGAGLAILEIDL
jgi:hypothetical protein